MIGGPALSTQQKRRVPTPPGPPGPPFALTSADNGLSVDPVSTRIVLGQAVGAAGDPARLLSTREIPMNGNEIVLKGPLQPVLLQEEIRFNESGFIGLAGAYLSSFGPGISLNNLNGGQIANIGFVDNGIGDMYFSIHDGNTFLKIDNATGQIWVTQVLNDSPPNLATFAVVGTMGSTGALFGRRAFVDGNTNPFPVDPQVNRSMLVNTALGTLQYDVIGNGIGSELLFMVTVAGTLTIAPDAGQFIRIGATSGAGGDPIFSSLVGSTITLTLNDQNEWVATSMSGVWSF